MFTISQNSPYKKAWELIGVSLLFFSVFDFLFLRPKDGFRSISHPFCDLYFFIDILLRFRTEFVDETTGEIVKDPSRIQFRYFRTWFVFDLVLSIPYGFVWYCFESRPAFRLLEIQESSRPMLNMLVNPSFRQHFLTTLRSHIQELQFLNSLLSKKLTTKHSLFRRGLRWVTYAFKLSENLKFVKILSSLSRTITAVVLSARTVSMILTSKGRRDKILTPLFFESPSSPPPSPTPSDSSSTSYFSPFSLSSFPSFPSFLDFELGGKDKDREKDGDKSIEKDMDEVKAGGGRGEREGGLFLSSFSFSLPPPSSPSTVENKREEIEKVKEEEEEEEEEEEADYFITGD